MCTNAIPLFIIWIRLIRQYKLSIEDDRVPPSQGKEFYRALKEIDVPTEMIMYPRTPHGPREPKFTADVSERILKWFDMHLGRDE